MIDFISLQVSDLIQDRIRTPYHRNEFPINQYAGEIIGIQRDKYHHYGIYLGDNQVIHYTSEDDDTSSDNEIMITSLDLFFRKQTKLFVVEVEKIPSLFDKMRGEIMTIVSNVPKAEEIKIYTPEETINNAKQRLGEKKYCVKTNNCEHFVYWAKMGLPISDQVKNVLTAIGIAGLGVGALFLIKKLLDSKTKK